jgi:hypothetical protein
MLVPNIPQRNIVIFKGLKLSDVRESITRVDQDIAEIATQLIKYDRLPGKFTGIEQWPISSNLRCWHCDIVIGDSVPLFVPLTLNMQGDNFHCNTEGVFNKWGCVMSYIDDHYNGRKWEQTRNLVKIVASIFTGKDVRIIQPAPPRTTMEPYGGDLSQEEYLRSIPL